MGRCCLTRRIPLSCTTLYEERDTCAPASNTAEWEKARSTYTSLLAYAQEVHAPVLERTALSYLAMLAEQ